MKVVHEYQIKTNDPKIKEVMELYSGLSNISKRKRVLTCYVFKKLYPKINKIK